MMKYRSNPYCPEELNKTIKDAFVFCVDSGISSVELPFYCSFTKQVWSILHDAEYANKEEQIEYLFRKWKKRGLDYKILKSLLQKQSLRVKYKYKIVLEG